MKKGEKEWLFKNYRIIRDSSMFLNAGIAKRNIPAGTAFPVSGAVTNVAASAVQMITVLKRTKKT
jgi:hypothetical protein